MSGCLNSILSVLEDTGLHSNLQASYASNNRYIGDFLTRLEGEYWQKRINQLKYEFSSSRLQPTEESSYPFDYRPVSAPAEWQQSSPAMFSSEQSPDARPRPVVARPIIRRDRSPSRPS